jgi:UDP-N-acetylmuramoylalanine--D-glutamate ligase
VRPWSELSGKRVLVIGMGRTGLASARVLTEEGARVTLADTRPAEQIGERLAEAEGLGVPLVLGLADDIPYADFAVVSPGLAADLLPLVALRQRGTPVISEIELAFSLARAPIVAVTGTNGKGTTVTLLGEMLRAAGREAVVAGNIGVPLVGEVRKVGPEGVIVAEVSTFQLEWIVDFRPRVGVLLNILVDHLDRHGTVAEYAGLKARLFANQTRNDQAVINLDDPLVVQATRDVPAHKRPFSTRDLSADAYRAAGALFVRLNGAARCICGEEEVPLLGEHNLRNVLAACLAASLCDAPVEAMAQAIREFRAPEHTLEPVAEVRGVRFINDSKGTNPGAVIAALEAMRGPTILIAGGRHKGTDLTALGREIAARAKALVLIGEAAGEIERVAVAAGLAGAVTCGSLEEAVEEAFRRAKPGDTVLLSPACASFDMFADYAERGRRFCEAVRALAARNAS